MVANEIFDKDTVLWYVMRAYKSEKRIEEALEADGTYEYFIPKLYAIRIIGGKKRKVLVPAIPSLLFVRTSRTAMRPFKEKHAAMQYAMWEKSTGSEFIIVPDKQMEDFIRVASDPEADTTYHSPDSLNLRKDSKVRIHGGRFDGMEGHLLRIKGKRGKRLVIQIEGIANIATAEVEADMVEEIEV